MNQEVQVKAISKEVIEVLVNLARGVIGFNVGAVILRDMKIDNPEDGKEIVYKFAASIEETLGKNGAYATLKQVGRDLSKKLMEENPEEEWKALFHNGLREFGYAKMIREETDAAFICSCVFYEKLQEDNLQPTQHPVCWTGWGFIEGFMKEFEGIQRIKWVGRDVEEQRCKFDFIRNNEDLNFKK